MALTRYRLELRGRAGWFVPAAEAGLDARLEQPEVRDRLVRSLASYGYVADPELAETYHLAVVEPLPASCPTGQCALKRR